MATSFGFDFGFALSRRQTPCTFDAALPLLGWSCVKGAKGLLLKKVTQPADGYMSGFCGLRFRIATTDLDFAVAVVDEIYLCDD